MEDCTTSVAVSSAISALLGIALVVVYIGSSVKPKCDCNSVRIKDQRRYEHLKQYYISLAKKYQSLLGKYEKTKKKLTEMVFLHFGEANVNRVLYDQPVKEETSSPSSD
jgi:hypothetical protein